MKEILFYTQTFLVFLLQGYFILNTSEYFSTVIEAGKNVLFGIFCILRMPNEASPLKLLAQKHPDANNCYEDIALQGPIKPIHPVVYEGIKANVH